MQKAFFVRSRADASIIGLIINPAEGVKIKVSDTPYRGEYGRGSVFGYSEKNWVRAPEGDAEAQACWDKFVADKVPLTHGPVPRDR
ncbi:hypothetical protein PUR29_35150 [Methylobacterium ajmalii]|uniref:Uncharacterized protein n=1 Tax=Methylobacterium ajmalii TaxID=2738439 RepID=A0ABV0A5X5_9HYPH